MAFINISKAILHGVQSSVCQVSEQVSVVFKCTGLCTLTILPVNIAYCSLVSFCQPLSFRNWTSIFCQQSMGEFIRSPIHFSTRDVSHVITFATLSPFLLIFYLHARKAWKRGYCFDKLQQVHTFLDCRLFPISLLW